MISLSTLESENDIILPKVYKDFFNQCIKFTPPKLVGTDLCNNVSNLKADALELIEECGIANFLEKDDFVFMMHQGYMFWYFKANGDLDPIVYGYLENKLTPDNQGHFSNFIKDFLE